MVLLHLHRVFSPELTTLESIHWFECKLQKLIAFYLEFLPSKTVIILPSL